MDRRRLLQGFALIGAMVGAMLAGMLALVWSPALAHAGADGKTLGKKDREMYRAIAYRIVDKLISAEGHDYPDLLKLSATAQDVKSGVYREESEDKLWIAYHYAHGMSWIPNPNHDPSKKGGAKVKSFAENGVELNLYFYEGEWMGQAAVSPLHIGQMKV